MVTDAPTCGAQELQRRYPDGLPRLDPIEDMRLEGAELEGTVRRLEALEKRLVGHPLHAQQKDSSTRRAAFMKKADLMLRRDAVRLQMKSSHVQKFREESKNRRDPAQRILGRHSELELLPEPHL